MTQVELKQFKELLEYARKEVATWPAWKRGLINESSKSTCDKPRPPVDNTHERNAHERNAIMDTQLLVFQCVIGKAAGDNEDLLKQVMVPDHIKTREEVRNWLTDIQGIGCRFMVISATQWDVAEIQSRTIKSTKWVGKACVTEDGNGPL